MSEQEVKPKLKKRAQQKPEISLDSELIEFFSPASAKDKDFDLDLDAARFQGKKGQAGTRTKSGNGDGFDMMDALLLGRSDSNEGNI